MVQKVRDILAAAPHRYCRLNRKDLSAFKVDLWLLDPDHLAFQNGVLRFYICNTILPGISPFSNC